ncbi:hypothetical protein NPIL_273161 [Nephila pilipes]|uniref:Uncharacterized protein n=1 Tax=Nephila pilipes TaxID=299642 RepID=A0A8X6U7G7_NEPPI|nr:hypothetical protein NPIL_273161 [Nephila pilipes]
MMRGSIDALNSSSIVNSSFKTSENCIINELSPRETELIHLPCNTVQGQNILFLPTATGHDCAVVLDSGFEATSISESPDSHDNSNVVYNDINSTYNDETLIRRPARAFDFSKNENSRGVEPATIPSPKCAHWYQNPKGASASGCLPSSSGASASRGNTSTGDAPFRLCPRFTIFGIEQTVSTTSVAASRNGGAAFERTIPLLKQYNLEPDPD